MIAKYQLKKCQSNNIMHVIIVIIRNKFQVYSEATYSLFNFVDASQDAYMALGVM